MKTSMGTSETNLDAVDDLALVQAVQRGELQAFEVLLERHLDQVHGFISLRLPLPHLVDELTHETFVFAFRRIHEFITGTGFLSWLLSETEVRSALAE
jgi:DNA-directed RNA polymerase specialized sigma24 family protein